MQDEFALALAGRFPRRWTQEESRDLLRSERRPEMTQARLSSPLDPSSFSYIVGIDIGSEKYSACVLKPDKRQVHKSRLFANAAAGFQSLQNQLAGLGVPAAQILIGMEATSRYGDAL